MTDLQFFFGVVVLLTLLTLVVLVLAVVKIADTFESFYKQMYPPETYRQQQEKNKQALDEKRPDPR